jgi:DNA-binding response OmpR family regulator
VHDVRERFPGTPTLVMTAYADEIAECEELFRKPFDTSKLVARVEALYERAHP